MREMVAVFLMCFIAFGLVNVDWLSIVYRNLEDGADSSDLKTVTLNSPIIFRPYQKIAILRIRGRLKS